MEGRSYVRYALNDHISPIYFDTAFRTRMFNRTKESTSFLQRMTLMKKLESHNGCVNTLNWNETGTLLLSGSDDHRLIITQPYDYRVRTDLKTSHKANIFSAKFIPATGDLKLVSCDGAGTIVFTDLVRPEETHFCQFTCHTGTTYEILVVPGDPNTFLSCGEDGTVRWYDLRVREKCQKNDCQEDVLISCRNGITSISLNPLLPYHLAVGSSDSTVRIFDRRMLCTRSDRSSLTALVSRFSLPEMEKKHRRITSVDYRPDGQEVCVSYSSDYIYLFSPEENDKTLSKRLIVGVGKGGKKTSFRSQSPPPMKRLRLRGDWSDTGPNARPEMDDSETSSSVGAVATSAGASTTAMRTRSTTATTTSTGPSSNLMQRMTDALSRMLNDPSTRLAMRSLGERHQSNESSNRRPSTTTATTTTATTSEAPRRSERRPSENPQSRRREQAEDSSIDNIQRSITDMRDTFIRRHNSEPDVNLTYSNQGPGRTSITMPSTSSLSSELDVSASEDDGDSRDETATKLTTVTTTSGATTITTTIATSPPLPGPSQVVTHPGTSGVNAITGQRQRRIGVSGPASGSIKPTTSAGIVTYSQNEEEDEENEGENIYEYEVDIPEEEEEVEDVEEEEEEEEKEEADCGTMEGLRHYSKFKNKVIKQPPVVKKFLGHRNARTMIKEATWWGNKFILSGSDCGHIFGWDRESEKLVLLLEADRHVVNCIQPHPFDPILATSGIDYNVKIWAPLKEEPDFDEEKAETLMKRNEVMLEETRDTITVPATLMIRMLASLNQIRRAGRMYQRGAEDDEDDDDDHLDDSDDTIDSNHDFDNDD